MALALTTAARVRAMLGKTSNVDDTIIGLLIDMVSSEFEALASRKILRAIQTEYLDVSNHQGFFFLSAWPVAGTPAMLVYHDTANPRAYGSDTLIDSDYVIQYNNEGKIYIEKDLQAAPRGLKIVYTGGLATVTTPTTPTPPDGEVALTTTYSDLCSATEIIVGFLYTKRQSIGLVSQAVGGATVSFYANRQSMPLEIQLAFDRFRKYARAI